MAGRQQTPFVNIASGAPFSLPGLPGCQPASSRSSTAQAFRTDSRSTCMVMRHDKWAQLNTLYTSTPHPIDMKDFQAGLLDLHAHDVQ